MKKHGLILASLLVLSACGDSELARQQYTEGVTAARDASCECDPFFSEAGSAASQSAGASPQWEQGYINTCVDLRRECAAPAAANE